MGEEATSFPGGQGGKVRDPGNKVGGGEGAQHPKATSKGLPVDL